MFSALIFSWYHERFRERLLAEPVRHTSEWFVKRAERLKEIYYCEYGDCHRLARDTINGHVYCYGHFDRTIEELAWKAYTKTWYGSIITWLEGIL